MKKTFLIAWLLMPFFCWGANFADVRINEFSPQPGSGSSWVELINSSGTNINLTGWQFTHYLTNETGSTTLATITLPAVVIPNEGLISFEAPSLGTTSDKLALLDNTGKFIHGVTYGAYDDEQSDHFGEAPAVGQSAATGNNGGGFWSNTSSLTRDWFNQTPTKQEILTALPSGSTLSLGANDNWTNVSGLTFGRSGKGSIVWSGNFNLTGSDDRTAIASLDAGAGYVKFNGGVNALLTGSNVQVIINGLLKENYTVSDIIVHDSAGNIVSPASAGYPVISNLSYAFENASGTLNFVASHPTNFSVTVTDMTDDTGSGSGNSGNNTDSASLGIGGGGSPSVATSSEPLILRKILGEKTVRFDRILRPGMSGVDVQNLQLILQNEKFFKAKVTKYFGPATKAALKAWQKKHNIRPATGVLGKPTLKYLNNLLKSV